MTCFRLQTVNWNSKKKNNFVSADDNFVSEIMDWSCDLHFSKYEWLSS